MLRLLDSPAGYLETEHAKERMREREITRQEIWHVLKTGRREPRKDAYNNAFNTWNYAMRGNTLTDRTLRVIVTVVGRVVVVTAMEIQR